MVRYRNARSMCSSDFSEAGIGDVDAPEGGERIDEGSGSRPHLSRCCLLYGRLDCLCQHPRTTGVHTNCNDLRRGLIYDPSSTPNAGSRQPSLFPRGTCSHLVLRDMRHRTRSEEISRPLRMISPAHVSVYNRLSKRHWGRSFATTRAFPSPKVRQPS